MELISQIRSAASDALQREYQFTLPAADILVNETKPEFEGDYTVVLFSFVKQLKKKPEELGNQLGKAMMSANPGLITGYNVIKGFLNLAIADGFWLDFLKSSFGNPEYGRHSR